MIYIGYYPSWSDLDSVIDASKQVNIFVDLKNCLTGLFMKEAIQTTIDVNRGSTQPITDIFMSWLDFVLFHFRYMEKHKINMNLFHISDSGDSVYHRSIYKDYKMNRTITKFNITADLEEDEIKKIVRQNLNAIHKAASKMYNNHSIDLAHFESDFVAHYLIKKQYNDDKFINIIYSRDTDMFQTLKFRNTKIFYRNSKDDKMFYDYTNWYTKFEKKVNIDPSFPIENFIYIKCIAGDKSDGVPGIRGYGFKKAYILLNNIKRPIDSIEDLKEAIEPFDTKHKVLDNWDIVERNYKLVCFDEIIKHIPYLAFNEFNRLDNQEKFSFGETMLFINKIHQKWGGIV